MPQPRAGNPAGSAYFDPAAASLDRPQHEAARSTPSRSGASSQLALTAAISEAQSPHARRGVSPGEPSWQPPPLPPARQHQYGQELRSAHTASGDSARSPTAALPGRPPRPAVAPSASLHHRPGSASASGSNVAYGISNGGGGVFLGAKPSTSSSASPSASASSKPAGAAYAAVRAVARAAGHRQAAVPPPAATAALKGGKPGSSDGGHVVRLGGDSSNQGSGGAGAGSAGTGKGRGSSSGDGGGGGAGISAGDDVSGLPLEQQVAHYARLGAAAAAGGNAIRAALAVHLLNGCFMRAPSYDRSRELAAAAVAAAPGLPAALVEAVSEGAPQSIASYNALSYLALSPEVVSRLLSVGLVPVLVGQLRAACSSSLEQQLLVSGLGLLLTMVRVDAEARGRLAGMRGVAAALAAALGRGAVAVRRPALQLVQELILTKKGLEQVRVSSALMAALDRLCEEVPQSGSEPGGQERGGSGLGDGTALEREGTLQRREQQQPQQQGQLQRQARSVRASIAALAVVMK